MEWCNFSREELYGNRNNMVIEKVVVSDGFLPAFLCIKCGEAVAQHPSKLIKEEDEEKNEDSE